MHSPILHTARHVSPPPSSSSSIERSIYPPPSSSSSSSSSSTHVPPEVVQGALSRLLPRDTRVETRSFEYLDTYLTSINVLSFAGSIISTFAKKNNLALAFQGISFLSTAGIQASQIIETQTSRREVALALAREQETSERLQHLSSSPSSQVSEMSESNAQKEAGYRDLIQRVQNCIVQLQEGHEVQVNQLIERISVLQREAGQKAMQNAALQDQIDRYQTNITDLSVKVERATAELAIHAGRFESELTRRDLGSKVLQDRIQQLNEYISEFRTRELEYKGLQDHIQNLERIVSEMKDNTEIKLMIQDIGRYVSQFTEIDKLKTLGENELIATVTQKEGVIKELQQHIHNLEKNISQLKLQDTSNRDSLLQLRSHIQALEQNLQSISVEYRTFRQTKEQEIRQLVETNRRLTLQNQSYVETINTLKQKLVRHMSLEDGLLLAAAESTVAQEPGLIRGFAQTTTRLLTKPLLNLELQRPGTLPIPASSLRVLFDLRRTETPVSDIGRGATPSSASPQISDPSIVTR